VIRRLGGIALALCSAALVAAPQAVATPPVRGLTYGPLPTELLTIYQPEGAAPLVRNALGAPTQGSPSVLLVHGGGWRQQQNETEQAYVAQDLRAHGFAVFDIDYPQANIEETAFPQEPEALASAVQWVREHAGEYGGDPQNVVLLGGSAGGHLVDVTAERVPGISAVVSLSGPTNLVSLLEMGQREGLRSSLTISLAIALGCGSERYGWEKVRFCGPAETQLAAEWSPVRDVPSGSCPKWMLFSAEEDLVPASQQQEFLTALHAGGCSASLTVVSGRGHSFGYWWRVKQSVYAFLAAN